MRSQSMRLKRIQLSGLVLIEGGGEKTENGSTPNLVLLEGEGIEAGILAMTNRVLSKFFIKIFDDNKKMSVQKIDQKDSDLSA